MLGNEGISWEEFKKIFIEKYFSETTQDRVREEFSRLEQERDYVADYAQKFISLARFAPNLVATESRKVKRFISGLRFNL